MATPLVIAEMPSSILNGRLLQTKGEVCQAIEEASEINTRVDG
jgi:hypothetical protein